MSATVPVRDGLWRQGAGTDLVLVCGTCDVCAKAHFPLAGACPYCGSTAVTEAGLGPRATLWGWTTVTVAPPGYEGPVPYEFGIVELPEGLRVVTLLVGCRDSGCGFGDAVEMCLFDLHRDGEGRQVVTWAFGPR